MKRRIGLSVSSARLYVLLCSVFWDDEARALLLLVDTWCSGVGWGVTSGELFIPPSLSIPVFLDPTLSLHRGMAKDPRKPAASQLSRCREAPAHSTSLVDGEMRCCLWRELLLRARFHMERVSVAYAINPTR